MKLAYAILFVLVVFTDTMVEARLGGKGWGNRFRQHHKEDQQQDHERKHQHQGKGQGSGPNGDCTGENCLANIADTIETLDENEKNILTFMRVEETLARDVYLKFQDKYPEEKRFSNIVQSEGKHRQAVKGIMDKVGLSDPIENHEIGDFSAMENLDGTLMKIGDLTVQEVFNDLIDMGDDLEGAIEAGILIEKTDITDLKASIDTVGSDSPIFVLLVNLLRASNNHLAAFEGNNGGGGGYGRGGGGTGDGAGNNGGGYGYGNGGGAGNQGRNGNGWGD